MYLMALRARFATRLVKTPGLQATTHGSGCFIVSATPAAVAVGSSSAAISALKAAQRRASAYAKAIAQAEKSLNKTKR